MASTRHDAGGLLFTHSMHGRSRITTDARGRGMWGVSRLARQAMETDAIVFVSQLVAPSGMNVEREEPTVQALL